MAALRAAMARQERPRLSATLKAASHILAHGQHHPVRSTGGWERHAGTTHRRSNGPAAGFNRRHVAAAVAAGTDVGKEAKAYMESGALVPDDVIVRIIQERLTAPDAAKGVMFDGFPRTIPKPKPWTGLSTSMP